MSKVCFLCKSSEDDELLFGKFYTKYRLSVHYYCLLLSSNLVQNGVNDTVGIFGFLEQDIRKENERTKKCRCYICKEMHANVSCCSKKCLRTFHTVCGIKNRCLSHFTDTFQSWCASHIPLDRDKRPHAAEEPCSICYDEMGQYDKITSIRAPCCRNGWFHQRCVAQYAQSAGYFFKCPLCNNEDVFLPEIPRRGVFVPERDAAWELEPNAFQEQLVRPTACDAEDCKCLDGRNVDNRQWRLVVCGSCGSTCRHRQCMEVVPELTRAYVCQLCRPILGERVASLVEDSDDDSSEDDEASTSLAGSVRKALSRPGSGESGVHCSSSDESAVCRRTRRKVAALLSDGSDSERSDADAVQIRRFVRQNTGKRVRRLLSDDSDEGNSKSTDEEEEDADKVEQVQANQCKVDDTSKPAKDKHLEASKEPNSTLSVDRSPSRHVEGEVSNGDGSVCNRTTSESSTEIRRPKLSKSRKSRLSTSSDESDKRLEGLDDLPLSRYCQLARSSKTKNPDSTKQSGDTDKTDNRKQQGTGKSTDKKTEGKERERKSEAIKMAITASIEQTDEMSDTSSLSSEGVRRTRQLTRRLSTASYAKSERSTSESSNEIVRPTRAHRARLCSSSDRSEKEETDILAPRTKLRRVSREKRNDPSPISPPSTPSSLTSESSQQSAPSGSSSGRPDTDTDLKRTIASSSPTSTSTSSSLAVASTPNRQQQQQSILKFISLSSRKTNRSSSSDTSMEEEEVISPPSSRLKANGNSGKQNGCSTGSNKRAIAAAAPGAAKRKRSSTNSPKQSKASKDEGGGGKQSKSGSKETTPQQGPTTSKKAKANPQREVAAEQRIVEKKDKGQKNILNYFNRC